jgi:hypothetical protein
VSARLGRPAKARRHGCRSHSEKAQPQDEGGTAITFYVYDVDRLIKGFDGDGVPGDGWAVATYLWGGAGLAEQVFGPDDYIAYGFDPDGSVSGRYDEGGQECVDFYDAYGTECLEA